MSMVRNYRAFILLIFFSLLLTPPKVEAVLSLSPKIDQTIKKQKKNRKKLRQEKRKLKNPEDRKQRAARLALKFLALGLIVATCFCLIGFIILLVELLSFGLGSYLLLTTIGLAVLMVLSFKLLIFVYGVLRGVKRARKPRVKRGL